MTCIHYHHTKKETTLQDTRMTHSRERRLVMAIAVNLVLTLVQIGGGVYADALSLIADALHNFGDAIALLIAFIAIKIGQRPADTFRTFGYKRAETVAALINLTTLILIGVFLIFEAVMRFTDPTPVEGWAVVWVAGVALIIDLITAALVFKHVGHNMNMKAAFLHNIMDALASVGVMISGTLILMYGWHWTDAFITLLISGYVLWHGGKDMPKAIHILMDGAPENMDVMEVIDALNTVKGVESIHHVHIWQMNEHENALVAHIVLDDASYTLEETERIRLELKKILEEQFNIVNTTLELEKED